MIMHINTESKMIYDLNKYIHKKSKQFEYHMKHIQLVQKYASIINERLGNPVSYRKLTYAAFAHDLFKERGLDPNREVIWKEIIIPQDNIRYVRTNLDILEKYQLDDYFNSSLQYHSLAAGIFLIKELHLDDKEILYPVFFHSCIIVDIYNRLSHKTRTMVDIIMLADKLSSNYLKINLNESPVRIDLDRCVFGLNGREFNYSLGLFLARLISQGKSTEENSVEATEFYFERLNRTNPLISKEYSIKMLGGNKKWEKRKSQALMMH